MGGPRTAHTRRRWAHTVMQQRHGSSRSKCIGNAALCPADRGSCMRGVMRRFACAGQELAASAGFRARSVFPLARSPALLRSALQPAAACARRTAAAPTYSALHRSCRLRVTDKLCVTGAPGNAAANHPGATAERSTDTSACVPSAALPRGFQCRRLPFCRPRYYGFPTETDCLARPPATSQSQHGRRRCRVRHPRRPLARIHAPRPRRWSYLRPHCARVPPWSLCIAQSRALPASGQPARRSTRRRSKRAPMLAAGSLARGAR